MKIPTSREMHEFYQSFLRRYPIGLTLDNGQLIWMEGATRKRMRDNHVLCLMRNDFLERFPETPPPIARRIAESTCNKIRERVGARLRAGEGSEIPVDEEYL